jgi:DNA replication protein DnaC
MLTHPLLPKLRALKLSGMLLTLDTRATQAAQGNLSPTEFLALLLDDELERRAQHRLERRVSEAGVDPIKALAQFDFAAVPALNRSLVLELATCGFIARAENVLLCGPTGTGKSHLANALAVEALKRGYTTCFGRRIACWPTYTPLVLTAAIRGGSPGCARLTCLPWTTSGCGPCRSRGPRISTT